MKITLPTAVTLFRIALIPLFVVVFYLPFSWANVAATSIFAIASISDWVDGYLARSMQQESSFGAFLDPVADKLMVVVIIVLLVEAHPSIYMTLPSVGHRRQGNFDFSLARMDGTTGQQHHGEGIVYWQGEDGFADVCPWLHDIFRTIHGITDLRNWPWDLLCRSLFDNCFDAALPARGLAGNKPAWLT